ncbi:hypothetical protein [Kitasatospora griseola]|uniref:hypothetical protein n=1 Tax=Kitasatospora griseola TaxID=2064 RepID=UPI0037FFCA46
MTDSLGAGSGTPTVVEQAGVADLQSHYEGAVLSLVVRDLAVAAPAADETAVMVIVTDVWVQAEQHATTALTSWAHLSWFVQAAVARFVGGLLPQMAGC